MNSFFNRRKNKPDSRQLLAELERWFDSERGAYLLDCQRTLLDEMLNDCFGYFLLQLSVDSRIALFDNCRVQQKYRCHPYQGSGHARCHFDQLPFANESVDVAVLHHVQEYVSHPHQLLREVQRVVVPHGHVMVMGFNPWSPLGLYSHIGHRLPNTIWHNHLISPGRMKDWLSLLGFETQVCQFGYHSQHLPEWAQRESVQAFMKSWPFGNFYLISAVKQVVTLTPSRPKWVSSRGRFVGLSPVKSRLSTRINSNQSGVKPAFEEDVA